MSPVISLVRCLFRVSISHCCVSFPVAICELLLSLLCYSFSSLLLVHRLHTLSTFLHIYIYIYIYLYICIFPGLFNQLVYLCKKYLINKHLHLTISFR